MATVGAARQETRYVRRDDAILGGEPAIRGTRIPVRSVVLAARDYGGVDGALRAYPQLSRSAVQDVLRFYETHRAEIERYIDERNADEALRLWSSRDQDRAMKTQFAEPAGVDAAEWEAWRSIRRAAATCRLAPRLAR